MERLNGECYDDDENICVECGCPMEGCDCDD